MCYQLLWAGRSDKVSFLTSPGISLQPKVFGQSKFVVFSMFSAQRKNLENSAVLGTHLPTFPPGDVFSMGNL